MGYFFLLLVAIIPLIVFLAKPEDDTKTRAFGWFMAVLMGYIFINLALHSFINSAWEHYNKCSGYAFSFQETDECKAPHSGPPEVFYLILGWVPVMGYVGILEFIWRIKHRKTIKQMGKDFKGKWASTFIISVSAFIFIIYPLCVMGSWVILSIMNIQ